MSMKQYLGLKMQSVKDRWRNRGEEEPERIDGKLPLNLRVGSRVQFVEAPFLIAGDATHVTFPGEETLLTAFSEVDLAGLKTFRLYLDSRDEPDQSAMLMVVMNEQGNDVDELYLFQEQYELPLYHVSMDDVGPER